MALKIIIFSFLSGISFYMFAQKPIQQKIVEGHAGTVPKSTSDTLWPGNSPAASSFVLISDSLGGYVLGNNSYHDICKGQHFKVDSGYVIDGAIYWFGTKWVAMNSTDSLRFVIWRMDSLQGYTTQGVGYPSPGTELGAVKKSLAEIDTSSALQSAYSITFPFPVKVLDDYVIGFDMSAMSTDTIGLISTDNGSGGGNELVWEKWSSNGTWHTLQASGWGYPALLDIDAMILPIVDMTSYGISDAPFINNISCKPIPNPASDHVALEVDLIAGSERNCVEIFDASGKRAQFHDEGTLGAGKHSIKLDVSDLSAGNYTILFSSGPGKYATRLIIVH